MRNSLNWAVYLTSLLGVLTSVMGAPVDFNRDVRPLLSDRCFFCHGPDAGARKADLRLDIREDALKETDSGLAAIAPGATEQSEIIKRIFSTDPDEMMPPPDSKLKLSDPEKETLRRWISEGATYDQHWSFRTLKDTPLPEVKEAQRARNGIDRFIEDRLEKEGWHLGEDAPKERLIRRATFDLTGLPPAADEIDAFLADTSDKAYEHLVDRLLRSERYGERMASEWLDVARYSDSFGYQVDRDRFVWPWRDWVIKAFNENLSYDQFITWQLAGDLLPNATHEQILATTFNRLHSQKVEGGSVPEEFRIEYVADRTHTFGTAFLGLTLECSRCHDHKYDPLAQKEYYQFSSFFANVDEAGLYSYFTDSIPTPTMLLPTDEQSVELKKLESDILVAETKAVSGEKITVAALSGAVAHFSFDERVDGKFPNAVNVESTATSSGANTLVDGKLGKALKLTGDDAVNLPLGNFTRNQSFSVSWWMQMPDVKERAVVFHRSRAWTDAASRGYEVLLEDGRLTWSLIHFWPGNAISIKTAEPLETGAWLHASVTYDGSSRADGLKIYLDGKEASVEVVRDQLTKNITGGGGDNITIGERFRDRGFAGGLVDDFRVFERALSRQEIAFLSGKAEKPIEIAVAETAALKELREKRSKLVDGMQEIMVMQETAPPRQSYLLGRGAYDAREEPVKSETPAALPPMAEGLPRNRLGLARWLTDSQQPLTARVTVNRYWQMFFGKGLVGTPEDFGSQGSLPTHPELLDWLAYRFMDQGWDLKGLVKEMVLSQTYRQTSVATAEQRARDPGNVLLARAPRYRWAAEMIRDNILFTSGLLVEKAGGPPVKPYEVAASFKPVDHEKGPGLYRRSLYTYWKRTSPAPVMIALDAPKRDVCMVKRVATATPLQAFVYMNDPQAIEAARTMAAALLEEYKASREGGLKDLFRRMTSRVPGARELEVLQRMLTEQETHFKTRLEQATAYLSTGESPIPEGADVQTLAAWAVVINSLMAYDDCIMKR
ncbi:MAG: hypothetical protein ACI9DF_005387 [Verrucomicrobiales bacterium]|jgi:hypothetical protein